MLPSGIQIVRVILSEESFTMRRGLMLLLCLAAVGAWSGTAMAGGDNCPGCAKIKDTGQGFCGHCGSGKVCGLKLASQKLYDVLAGSTEMADKAKESKCPDCQKAVASGGSCAKCGVHIAGGKGFKSEPAYAMAKGEWVSPEKAEAIKCPGCTAALKSNGFCATCKVGYVGERKFEGQESYDLAVAAYEVVKAAIEDAKHCDQCAVARLTDGRCPQCGSSFKQGKPSDS